MFHRPSRRCHAFASGARGRRQSKESVMRVATSRAGVLTGLVVPLAGCLVSVPGHAHAAARCLNFTATIEGTEGDDVIIGTDGLDVIVTFGGNDAILGGEGVDIICSGAGDDQIWGGSNDDLLVGGPGDDRLLPGIGFDTVYYSDAAAGVSVDLDRGLASGGDGNDILDLAESVVGSSFDDVLVGNSDDNSIIGNSGND